MREVRSKLAGDEQALVVRRGDKAPRGEANLAGLAIARTEVRTSNQRREERQVMVSETASLRFRDADYEVRVTNVSNHGAMIEADIAPHIGERVQIAFEGCIGTDCTVRWVRSPRIGLEFFTETVIAGDRGRGKDAAPEPRQVKPRPPRQALLWTAVIHWTEGSQHARLRNVSAAGAMLEAQEDLERDLPVVLDLGRGGAVAGRVRWSRAGQIGVAFDERYDLRQLGGGTAPDVASASDVASPWEAPWERQGPQDLGV